MGHATHNLCDVLNVLKHGSRTFLDEVYSVRFLSIEVWGGLPLASPSVTHPTWLGNPLEVEFPRGEGKTFELYMGDEFPVLC